MADCPGILGIIKEFELQKEMLAKSAEIRENRIEEKYAPRLQKKKEITFREQRFHRGDSVMIYPDKKNGIVCQPEDYDFSIVFDSVEVRKLRHKMARRYVEGEEIVF